MKLETYPQKTALWATAANLALHYGLRRYGQLRRIWFSALGQDDSNHILIDFIQTKFGTVVLWGGGG
jgi:hypothetical protein